MEATERKVTPIRDQLAYRQPPHNYETEQALLGAILVMRRGRGGQGGQDWLLDPQAASAAWLGGWY